MKPIPPSKLSKVLGTAAQTASTSLLRKTFSGALQRGELIDLPIYGKIYMQMLGARQWQEAVASTRSEMERLGFGADITPSNASNHELELAVRVLTIAARDPDDVSQPYGPLDEWAGLENDVLNIAWLAFTDVRSRLDPVGSPLTSEEMLMIQVAVKKKDGPLLRSFGTEKLSSWLLSMGDRLLISPTASSPTTESSPDS